MTYLQNEFNIVHCRFSDWLREWERLARELSGANFVADYDEDIPRLAARAAGLVAQAQQEDLLELDLPKVTSASVEGWQAILDHIAATSVGVFAGLDGEEPLGYLRKSCATLRLIHDWLEATMVKKTTVEGAGESSIPEPQPTGRQKRDPDLLSVRNVAEKLGVSETTVRRMVSAGELVKANVRGVKVHKKDLESYIEASRTVPGDTAAPKPAKYKRKWR